MAKMFYKTAEAAQKLGVTQDQLKEMVAQNKLREFRDGADVMFKVDQVDKIAADKGRASQGSTVGGIGLSDSGIALAGDSMASDVISLADTSTPGTNAKDDTTVVTGQGKNVFESGEIKSSDTGAQTRIQSAIDDQLSLEGVGSGSGLLDLTRESDDTSLGAELLDEIYPGGDAKGDSGIASASGIFEQSAAAPDASGPSGLEHMAATTTTGAGGNYQDIVEQADPSAGAFGGLALATILIAVVTAIIAISFFGGYSTSWMDTLTSDSKNVLFFGIGLVVVSALFAGIGFFAGKSSAE